MESMGIVLVEALATGTPIMASPCGGIPEIFEDGVEGRYWDINDVEASAQLLIEVLSDQQMLQAMSHRALKTHSARFTKAVALPKWLDLLSGD
jgi:glycosyltransferase involved in cell wall biosynthesis